MADIRASWSGAAIADPAIRADLTRAAIWMEMTALFCALFLFSNALGVFYDAKTLADDLPIMRALWYPVYLLGLVGAAMRPARMTRYVVINALAFAPVLMVAASYLWSIDPPITFRRAIALGCCTMFGIYMAARFDWRDFLRMLALVFGALAIACVITALAFPARGIMHEIHPGAWSGVWTEKNEMGSMMARGVLVFGAIALLYPDLRRRAWVWAGLGLCVGLVLLSTSKTSLLAVIAIAAIMVAVSALRRGAVTGVLFAALAGLGATLFAGLLIWNLDLFFELLGKERSLTGRTDIWAALIQSVSEKPLLGYGYGVFWRGEYGPAWWVRQATEWEVPTAHNGWFETALNIGLIGLAITAVYVVAAAAAGVARIWSHRATAFALPYIGLTILFSFSESVILQHNNLAWMLFVAISAKLFVGDDSDSRDSDSVGRTGAGGLGGRGRAATVTDYGTKSEDRVSSALTLFRVTLRPGAPMIDLSADLANLASGLDRTRPPDGRGRVIMFTSPRTGLGTSLLAREFARLIARRAPRGVWLFDLDLSRNEHFRKFTTTEARQRYGPIGQALDATLGQEPFWKVSAAKGAGGDESRPVNAASLMTLHRVGGTRLFVSRFHPELVGRNRRLNIRAAHSYWERLRDTVELAVIDAPAPERSLAGRALYGEADAVVIVVDDNEDTLREAEILADTVRDRGGLPAGVIVNMADGSGRAEEELRAG